METKKVTRRKVLLWALFHKKRTGLCATLEIAIEKVVFLDKERIIVGQNMVSWLFPKYSRKNAERFGAYKKDTFCSFGYWWRENDWIPWHGRMRFFIWLIKVYWNDKTDLRELI